jgi:hypothetical protein
VALLAALAFACWRLFREAPTGLDLEFHMAWARELVGGHLPDFSSARAPTEHPLTLLAATVAELVPGIGPRSLLRGSAYLAYAGLVVVVLAVGTELFNGAAGVVAATAVAVSSPMAANTMIAFQDVSATTLVLTALLLAIRRPDRPGPPLAVLALAGLLRPEVWLLSGAFCLAQLRGRSAQERQRMAALALCAPLLWFGTDLICTGKPFFSFTGTRSSAEMAHRTTGLTEAPHQFIDGLRLVLETVVRNVGALGAIAAALLLGPLRRLQHSARPISRRAGLALASLLLSSLAFFVLAMGRFSLLERYLFVPATLLALFFGFAVTCAWHLAPRAFAVVAAGAGAVALLAAIHKAHSQVDQTRAVVRFARVQYAGTRGLDQLGTLPAVNLAFRRCDAVAVTSYRMRPYLANDLRRSLASVLVAGAGRPLPPRVALVAPNDAEVRDALLLLGLPGGPLPPPPPDYRVAAANSEWRVMTRGC